MLRIIAEKIRSFVVVLMELLRRSGVRKIKAPIALLAVALMFGVQVNLLSRMTLRYLAELLHVTLWVYNDVRGFYHVFFGEKHNDIFRFVYGDTPFFEPLKESRDMLV